MSGIREFSLSKAKENVHVSKLSKVKTTLQFLILSYLLILYGFLNKSFFNLMINYERLIYFGICGLWLVTILTLYTGFQYCYKIYIHNRVGLK